MAFSAFSASSLAWLCFSTAQGKFSAFRSPRCSQTFRSIRLAGIGGLIELIGGILFTIGLFTRPVAFILSGFTAAAYFMAHAGKGFYPLLNGGELAALYCFVFLYFTFAGAGPWSADALIRRK